MLFFRCIPEFIIENLTCFIVFLRRFAPDIFEQEPYEHLEVIMSFTLIFMGSKERMRNPHGRAKLAEVLEALLPQHKDDPVGLNTLDAYQRTKLFKDYPFRKEVKIAIKCNVECFEKLCIELLAISDCLQFVKCFCSNRNDWRKC